MEQRNYKLYVHIAPNGKRYYGITGMKKVEYRWVNGNGYKKNEHFYNAINKYSWNNFQHIVLFDNLTKEEACLLEQCYIALYDTANPKYGYNNSLGGEHGLFSEQSKKKMSQPRTTQSNLNKQIRCIDTGVIYNDAYEVAYLLGLNVLEVLAYINNSDRTMFGCYWEYVE